MYGPILTGETKAGELIRLRPPSEFDAPIIIYWMSDLEVTQTLLRLYPMSLDSEQEWLKKQATDPSSVIWAIDFGKSSRMVGITGIHQIDPIHRHATTGTFIGDKTMWGKGIATTTMQLRTHFAFEHMGLHKLSSAYLDGNDGSAKAQAKSGYREAGRKLQEFWRNGQWVDEILTEVLADDWRAARSPG